jgi:hypothetical protein
MFVQGPLKQDWYNNKEEKRKQAVAEDFTFVFHCHLGEKKMFQSSWY